MAGYKGQAPCQGCGKTGTEKTRWYGRDRLCGDCQDTINKGKRFKEQTEDGEYAALFFGPRWEPNGRWLLLDVRELNKGKRDDVIARTRQLPYVSEGFMDNGKHEHEVGSTKALYAALERLGLTLDLGEKSNVVAHLGHRTHNGTEAVVSLETARAWTDLLDTIAAYGDRLRREAKAEGTNLLFQLNEGTIKVSDFNRRSGEEDE